MGMTQIVIETAVGDIVAQLYREQAPLTTDFFLGLVSRKYYQDGTIYRSTQLGIDGGPYLLQGGAALPFLQGEKPAVKAPMLEQIETTGTTGILHRRGTLSLARDLGRTGHALAEFFVCLGDFPILDEGGRNVPDEQGFPAFGSVLSGLKLLDAVATQETNGDTHLQLLKGQMLSATVKIERIRLIA